MEIGGWVSFATVAMLTSVLSRDFGQTVLSTNGFASHPNFV